MANYKKFIKFLNFSMGYKFPKLVKKMTDTECLEVYYKYALSYWSDASPLKDKLMGAIVILTIGNEFKRRYPSDIQLQNWNYSQGINLYDVIRRHQNG